MLQKGCKEVSELHEGDFVYVRPQGNEKSWGKGCCPRTSRHPSKQYQERKRRISQKQTTEIFGKRPIPRMLNKHPDAITAKIQEVEQDHPKKR